MEYDIARRYPAHNLSFPNYYYNDRNAPLAISHVSRPDHRGYPIGGPVGAPRGRPGVGRDEPVSDSGTTRRRIPVACARCRKRKIRCSGDPGNGVGCTNCRQAGVDAFQCHFHRVGSDNVQKVMDNYHMASSNGMMPLYSGAATNSMYARSMSSQAYPQLDTKSMYHSAWTVPYTEDTSPIETYGLDQPAAYLPNPTPINGSSMYGSPCRWTHPITKSSNEGASAYYDQEPNGLPYIHTSNLRATATSEATSPLNMSSFHSTLPERPHTRQNFITESAAPQRQLPVPQPSGTQSSRNVVDQLQDQRLRSAQAISASSIGSGTIFAKPLLSWSTENDHQVNASAVTSSEGSTQPPKTTDGTLDYLNTATSLAGDVTAVSTTAHLQGSFNTPSLLDAMHISAPVPAATYSNFRESRVHGSSSAHLARHNSQANLYSFNTGSASKRNSLGDESSSGGTLANGQPYVPLPHQQSQSSRLESLQRQPCENRTAPLQRASMGNISSSF